jgi:hypothetical protein
MLRPDSIGSQAKLPPWTEGEKEREIEGRNQGKL